MDRIKALPERTAYTVLLALCNDPSILKRAVEFSELLQPPPESAHYEPSASQSQRKKRKSPMVYTEDYEDEDEFECERCSETFLRSQDREGACVYHEGEVEPDYDGFWEDLEDFDEDNDGPIDTDEMRQRFPQGFFWDCCGKKLSDQGSGCRTGSHMARNGGIMKRSRVSIDEDTPDIVLSPEPPHLRQTLHSQQTPSDNPYSFVDNSDDDDLVELDMQPVGGSGSSATSSGNNTVQATRYIEINEVVEIDGDSDADTNGHQYDSGREKT
ncbi:hypothetical protein MCOR25_005125 [Pyricularia grisea]|uniref:C2H2-type domain-containing protein n=1 Tax=Pyricularia grisea TaxID=148305 RepID=A0A6P8BBC1_PYRGI|nr:uncharacterized protein PgNI_05106 [Pyricularia grisea]KAI6366478.1 hypothetical protein MCOR25_005125 [Pyricularia grisea]TLD13099.1 hypothetical protein PgNI_05106 [Pyricularia grisea]